MSKENLKHFLGATAFLLLAVVCFIVLTDPFYHYHGPWLGMKTYLYEAVYQAPGAARNMEYDSAIVGTSMTENFETAWFEDELGWNTVKLSYSGARPTDLAAILERAFSGKNEIKNVFMDINGYQLTVHPETAFVERPEYLYDENPFNDVAYVLNKDVLFTAAGSVVANLLGREDNASSAYSWGEEAVFGKEVVFDELRAGREEAKSGEIPERNTEEMLDWCRANLLTIGGQISEHPDTTFYIFYPPYSILYWEELIYRGSFEGMAQVYEMSMEYFLQFPNVKLYFFMDETELITDLDSYLDACHHTPEINRFVFESVKTGNNEITKENYKTCLHDFLTYAREFDYDEIWAQDVR